MAKKVCLFWEICLFWEVEDFASSVQSIPYSLYGIDSSIRIGLFVYNFRKIFFWLKKCLKKYRLFIFLKSSPSQNKHIFVWTKRVCLFLEMCLFWGSLLWVGKVSGHCLFCRCILMKIFYSVFLSWAVKSFSIHDYGLTDVYGLTAIKSIIQNGR